MPPGRPRAHAPSRFAGSAAAVAEWFGVSSPTVQQWLSQSDCPQRTEEGYDLRALCRWDARRRELRRNRIDGSDSGEAGETKEEAERRLKIAQADKAERERDQATGLLLERTEHERILLALIDSFVSGLETLPARVTPLLTAARGHQEIMTILQDHIRSLRIQLAAQHSPRPKENHEAEAGKDGST